MSVWWRSSLETLAKHRNPLFCRALGITLLIIAIDTLHTLHLGVLKRFVMWFFWKLFELDVFGVAGQNRYTAEE